MIEVDDFETEEERLKSACLAEIMPIISEDQNIRKSYHGKFFAFLWSLLFINATNSLVSLYNVQMNNGKYDAISPILFFVISLCIVYSPIYLYKKKKKHNVLELLIKLYGNFNYSDITRENDKKSLILPHNGEKVIVKQCVGNLQKSKIYIEDEKYSSTLCANIDRIVSSGIHITFDFTQIGLAINNDIVLIDDKLNINKKLFSQYISNLYIPIPATNYFKMFCKDKENAISYLISFFFETILDLKDAFKANTLNIQMIGNKVEIFIGGGSLYIKNDGFWGCKITEQDVSEMYDKINAIFNTFHVIKDLYIQNSDSNESFAENGK